MGHGTMAALIPCRAITRRNPFLGNQVKSSKWLWAVVIAAMISLSGCGMYPTHPGVWPGGPWGDALKYVSHFIDILAGVVGGNYGIALLLATVLVRLLLLPLMIKQIRYSKVMQQMQPEINSIRSKYKGDSRKIQEETMKLWQQAGVNPMAGCFPMLLQLPILYALYGAIYGNIRLNNSAFLWAPHLGQHDPTYILPILAAITTYFSSRVMMTTSDPQQRIMLFIMPVMVLLIGTKFPAGLALYWVFTNVFTTVQTYFIRVRPLRLAAEEANSPDESDGGGKKASKRGSSK